MKSIPILNTVLFFVVTFDFEVNAAQRERRLMDLGLLFHLRDAPETFNQFDYPGFKRLDKTRPHDDAKEAQIFFYANRSRKKRGGEPEADFAARFRRRCCAAAAFVPAYTLPNLQRQVVLPGTGRWTLTKTRSQQE